VALSPSERQRYARHLLLPEIGSSGQERLCAARVRMPDGVDPATMQIASEYLERAGVLVGDEGRELQHVEVQADPLLAEAARALGGALSAVEAVKAILGIGAPLKGAPVKLSSEDV
jgi:hypothetical protein